MMSIHTIFTNLFLGCCCTDSYLKQYSNVIRGSCYFSTSMYNKL